jgi:glyoxylate utilization-related uncharacterized protein
MNTGQLEKELEGMNHWVRSVRVANGYLFCGGRNQIMVRNNSKKELQIFNIILALLNVE